MEDAENVEYCSPLTFPPSVSELLCIEAGWGCLGIFWIALLDADANWVGGGTGDMDDLGGDIKVFFCWAIAFLESSNDDFEGEEVNFVESLVVPDKTSILCFKSALFKV